MRTKLLLLASSVWLLFGIPAWASEASSTPTPSADVAQWLQVEADMTCSDSLFLADKFLSEAEANYLRTLPEDECIPPSNMSRQEALDFIRNDFYLPDYVYNAPPDEDIVITVPSSTSPSTGTSVAPHKHDHSRLPRDHSHGHADNGG